MTAARLPGIQRAAILMLALGEQQCSRLLSMMHTHEIDGISKAMSQLHGISAETVETLCADFSKSIRSARMPVDGFDSMENLRRRILSNAHIPNVFRSATDGQDETARHLKSPPFGFDDIGRLTPVVLEELTRSVPEGVLALALKGASDSIHAVVVNALSASESRRLQDDMAHLGPVRLRDVDEAQRQVTLVARALWAETSACDRGEGRLVDQRFA